MEESASQDKLRSGVTGDFESRGAAAVDAAVELAVELAMDSAVDSDAGGVVGARDDGQPSFNYDLEIFNQCQTYLNNKNHQGLALIARQKGLPPFLRFKIWPILLKHHPYVVNPFIQPDGGMRTGSQHERNEEEIKHEIRKDLFKYVQRLSYSSSSSFDMKNSRPEEKEIFDILEASIYKFIRKWGKIIKYDSALTWIALGLAEWFPPIPHTALVLCGRDATCRDTCVKNLFSDYTNYIHNIPDLQEYVDSLINDNEINNMTFHDVYERLVLVLLHSPDEKAKDKNNKRLVLNKRILVINGGSIEERVSFFIYSFRKLLPELSDYFQEEQILNKFGSNDDEWLIWWLKWCGSKVWSKYDRGRIWDLLFGWRMQNSRKSNSYYLEKLDIAPKMIDKLGPDNFWSVGEENDEFMVDPYRRSNSIKDLVHELNITNSSNTNSSSSSPLNSLLNSPIPSSPPGMDLDNLAGGGGSSLSSSSSMAEPTVPFSRLDPHIELLFVTLALLKSKENILVELDQHEIRQYLSRLPTKLLSLSKKYKEVEPQNGDKIISNDSTNNLKIDFMDNIINEAGELWRKWLWLELVDDK